MVAEVGARVEACLASWQQSSEGVPMPRKVSSGSRSRLERVSARRRRQSRMVVLLILDALPADDPRSTSVNSSSEAIKPHPPAQTSIRPLI
jgi:hypothetical protein